MSRAENVDERVDIGSGSFESEDIFSNQGGEDNQWPIQDDGEVPPEPGPAAPAAAALAPGQPAAAPAQPAQPADPNAIREVRLPTGHVLRGTPDEIIQQQQAIIARGSQSQPLEYQRPVADRNDRGNRGWNSDARTATDGRQPWTTEKKTQFYETFAKDPEAAMDMFMRDRLGEDFMDRLDHSYSVAVQVSDRIAIADFLSNTPDFPASNESAALVIKRLAADGADVTAVNLKVAFEQLVIEGALAKVVNTPAPAAQPADYRGTYERTDGGQGQGQPSRPSPSPTPSRGAGAAPAVVDRGGPPDPARANMRLSLEEFNTLSSVEMRRYMADHTIPDRFFQRR